MSSLDFFPPILSLSLSLSLSTPRKKIFSFSYRYRPISRTTDCRGKVSKGSRFFNVQKFQVTNRSSRVGKKNLEENKSHLTGHGQSKYMVTDSRRMDRRQDGEKVPEQYGTRSTIIIFFFFFLFFPLRTIGRLKYILHTPGRYNFSPSSSVQDTNYQVVQARRQNRAFFCSSFFGHEVS